jgi:hypothetical protein
MAEVVLDAALDVVEEEEAFDVDTVDKVDEEACVEVVAAAVVDAVPGIH